MQAKKRRVDFAHRRVNHAHMRARNAHVREAVKYGKL